MAVVIPTYQRGISVLSVLEKIENCDPLPSELWVHIDSADGELEREISQRFPAVKVLTSTMRIGPGGGRHKCFQMCTVPYAVSFDDDSYPIDRDFFAMIESLFVQNPDTAILAASIWHRHEAEKPRRSELRQVASYVGCGYAIRLTAYRSVRGYLPLPVAYGLEETDLSLQLLSAGWKIVAAGELRVFHDTELKHHDLPDITAGTITNVGLFAFLHYPLTGAGWGVIQLANKIWYCVRRGRVSGIWTGLRAIPYKCHEYRRFRKPVSLRTMKQFRFLSRLSSR